MFGNQNEDEDSVNLFLVLNTQCCQNSVVHWKISKTVKESIPKESVFRWVFKKAISVGIFVF